MIKSPLSISNKTVAYNGAIAAVGSIFGYSMIVMVYVILRSSITIFIIMPNGERNAILWANGISVAYSVAIFSLFMALVSAGTGAIAAVVLKKSMLYFNPGFIRPKASLVSCITSLILLSVMYLILYSLVKEKITFNYTQTFLLWFLIPAVILFSVSIIGRSELNTILSKERLTKTSYADV